MQKFSLSVLGLIITFMTAAGAQDVHLRFDSKADFSKYRTCKWVKPEGEIKPARAHQVDEDPEKQIAAAIDSELSKKV